MRRNNPCLILAPDKAAIMVLCRRCEESSWRRIVTKQSPCSEARDEIRVKSQPCYPLQLEINEERVREMF
ncbi:hypothetical protein NDU88_005671 [Pleurodeles waltl]|uniref:Uncharacterized protein n=1 Tax=Pleurodeles waltl TaxID=8319 RepID=A0AAV7QFE3_PLEWA|nr:hypothetical protein NDU88_005671 [Pleurodeles waltl]